MAPRDQPRVSVGVHVFTGAVLIIAASVAARALGVIGTLVLTHFIAPDAYGDVAVASIVVFGASQLASLAGGPYVMAHPRAGRAAVFDAFVCHLTLGLLVLSAIVLLRDALAPLLGAPGMAALVPGFALAVLFDRITYVPERVLLRDLRFGVAAGVRLLGEIAYTVVSVAFAITGWGAVAIVAGNLARSFLRMSLITGVVDRREWLAPSLPAWRRVRAMLAFGLPLSVGALAGFAARRVDTLLVSGFFGASAAGTYNLAYSLAEIPAEHVGERVSDVLVPSFARMDPRQCREVLARSVRLLGLVMFPLALGLGAVAPTLVRTVLDPRWQPVGFMLTILVAFTATAPLGSLAMSYLLARHRPRAVMTLEWSRLITMLLLILAIGRLHPVWVCVAVAVAFVAHAIASFWCIARVDATPVVDLVAGLARPLAACVPMLAAVAAVRAGAAASGWDRAPLLLVAEILAGGAGYLVAAALVAQGTARELGQLIARALARPGTPFTRGVTGA